MQEFGAGDGPACQEGLLADAERANEQGFSWLTEMWLEGYLTVRTSLPLSSNVGFEMTWPSSLRGTARAADLAHRFAQVHLQHLRGETEPAVSPRGEPLCMRQWTYLAGGLRRPEPGADEIMPGPEEAADREILVMHEGRGFAVKVSDAQGQVLPLATLIESLDTRVMAGFGGVAEYGITVRWDKNFLHLVHLMLARRRDRARHLRTTLSIARSLASPACGARTTSCRSRRMRSGR